MVPWSLCFFTVVLHYEVYCQLPARRSLYLIAKLQENYHDVRGVSATIKEVEGKQPSCNTLWEGFMELFLVFLCEFHKRIGEDFASDCLQTMLSSWKFSEPFAKRQRCMFSYMFDSTSLWCVDSWLRPRSEFRKSSRF